MKNFVRNEDPPGKLGVPYEYSEVSHRPRDFEQPQPKFFIPPTLINEIDEDNYS